VWKSGGSDNPRFLFNIDRYVPHELLQRKYD
jgi:hypothetical protein